MTTPISPDLARLADALGVATRYEDYLHRPVDVGATAVRRALTAMGVAADDDREVRESLDAVQRERAQRLLPPSLVVRTGQEVVVPAPADGTPLTITREDGEQQPVTGTGGELRLPKLPAGYHSLAAAGAETATHLIVSPGRCPLPLQRPSYGWMAQLYAARSARSWGIGDCADLATLARWSGQAGAAMILVNPLHATTPVLPQEASPYSPTSRRYRNLLYLRIEDIPEFDGLSADDAGTVAQIAATARKANATDRIDRDEVFAAKLRALELIAAVPRPAAREAEYRTWRDAEGQGLVDFATFCVLAEQHGAFWQDWPGQLRHPSAPAVAAARDAHPDRVEFHMWVQWLCDTQLEAAQAAATQAGMAVGIVHDLAVGVNPGGADAWALQDDLATGMTIGAPPDGFNQRGQDWGLPPLLPTRLSETGYRPFRDMLRSVLHHAGGIRIDHIMGLWRLWWVPTDGSAADGTYVRYPADDLLGILALEADRAGAMVVGEDLGTVETGVRETMAEHRILSSRVLYFERIDEDPQQPMLPAADYPDLALTSITTHDLPTAPGWWADEEIRVQSELGLFGDATTPEAETKRKAGERHDMLELLRTEGLIGDDPTEHDLVVAMHAFVARTPSLLVATGLGDALGDRRQPNMPGTTTEYPSWRLPLAKTGPNGSIPVLLEDFMVDQDVTAVVRALAERGTAAAI
jgi:4-alpha-glucanotransferase